MISVCHDDRKKINISHLCNQSMSRSGAHKREEIYDTEEGEFTGKITKVLGSVYLQCAVQ